jgi:hypothetical protein
MKQEQGRVNLPALGMATALALAVTMGVPAAMQFTAPQWMAPRSSRRGRCRPT